jgi:hypothetical protein
MPSKKSVSHLRKKRIYDKEYDAEKIEESVALAHKSLANDPHFKTHLEWLSHKREYFIRAINATGGTDPFHQGKAALCDEILEDVIENFFQADYAELSKSD